MKKIKFLVFLVSIFGYSVSLAQKMTQESPHHYIRDTSIVSAHDDLGTMIVVSLLIIGVYVLFWYRQKI